MDVQKSEQAGGDEKGIDVAKIQEMVNDYSSADIKVFLKKIWLIQY